MSNKNSNFPNAKKPDCTPEEISKSLRGFDKIIELPPCTKNNPDLIRQRVAEMFRYCEAEGRKPTNEMLVTFLGVSRMCIWKWQQDESSEAGRLITQAKNLINVLLTEWGLENKVPFQMTLWLQKNWYGYRDVSDINISTSKNIEEELPSRDQIIKRLPEIVDMETEPDIEDII